MLVQSSKKGIYEQKMPMGGKMRRELGRLGTDPA